MRYTLRDSRALIAFILLAVCGAPLASAEIFKCATKDGTPLYQNFPCQFDSIGWVPPNSQAVKMPSVAPTLPQPKPNLPPAETAPTVTVPDARQVLVGMTPKKSERSWGNRWRSSRKGRPIVGPRSGDTSTGRYSSITRIT